MAYTTVYLGDQRCIVADIFAELPTTDDIVIGTPAKVGKNDYTLGQDRTWIQTSFGGAVGVSTSSSSTWSYGNYPETWYLNGTATGGAQTDNTAIYTSPDVSTYNTHVIENTSTTDPVDVYVSVDGTNFLATASAVKLHDATASATHVVTIPAGDVGILTGKFRKIRVLKDGATAETPSIRYSHSVV